jgi:hypothetical protein
VAVQYVTNALGGTADTTSFSITLPATSAGQLLILEYTHRGTGTGTIGGTSVSTGGLTWNNKHSQAYATNTFSGHTYWTIATGNHSGQTVTGTGLTNSCAAIVTIYSGTHQTTPLSDATVVGEDNASGNETQAQITVATGGAFVVLVVANSPDLAVTSQSCTSPGALTARAERLSTGGTDTSIAHASAEKTAPGATGALTWAQTNAVSGSWAYAIKPAPFAASIDAGSLTVTGQTLDTYMTSLGGNAWALGAWASGAWADNSWDGMAATGDLSSSIDTAGALTVAGQSVTANVGVAVSEGALTLAGQSVLAAVSVALSNGALTVAGETLTTDLTLDLFASIDPGAITLAGQSVTVNDGVALGNGTITIAGQTVTTNTLAAWAGGAWAFGAWANNSWRGMLGPEDLSATIEAGALTIAGQTVNYQWTVPWSEGAITITGQSVTANVSTALTQGALTIAGQSVTASLDVALSQGAITVAGQTLTPALGADLSVDIDTAGALTVTGQTLETQLGSSLSLSIEVGALTISGQTVDTTLDVDHALSIDAGAVGISGQAHAVSLTLVASNGELTLAGQSLVAELGIALSSGGLTVAGSEVGLDLEIDIFPWVILDHVEVRDIYNTVVDESISSVG